MASGIFRQIQDTSVAGEPLVNILWCTGIFAAALLLRRPLSAFVAALSCRIATRFSHPKYAGTFRQLTRKPIELLLSSLLVFIALNQLSVILDIVVFSRSYDTRPDTVIRISNVVDKLFMLLILFFSTLLVSRILDYGFLTLTNKAREEKNREKEQLFPLLKDMSKIALWVIGIFWILGAIFLINVPALVTGIGIGGIAIALAAKESVENFFASFVILTDKPFRTGDIVRIDAYEGTVERVGFRSTRLRHINGSLFIVPNKRIIGENLENLSERNLRRMQLILPLGYGFSPENLQSLIAELKHVLAETNYTIGQPEVFLEEYQENVFLLNLLYYLPVPLPAEAKTLNEIKQDVHIRVYAVLARYATVRLVYTTVWGGNESKSTEA